MVAIVVSSFQRAGMMPSLVEDAAELVAVLG
jgi:hypothetical protein